MSDLSSIISNKIQELQLSENDFFVQLALSVVDVPEDATYCVVDDKKAPFEPRWNETKLHPQTLAVRKLLTARDSRTQGYGIVLGDNYIECDIDSQAGNEDEQIQSLPHTVSWTSGKPYRYGKLFRVTEEQKSRLGNFQKLNVYLTEESTKSKKPDYEIRYSNHQCVLPPSKHPETGQYEYLVSFQEAEVAEAPEWLISMAVASMPIALESSTKSVNKKLIEEAAARTVGEENEVNFEQDEQWDIDVIHQLVVDLTEQAPESASVGYAAWLEFMMACHATDPSDEMLALLHAWSGQSSMYNKAEVDKKWLSFKEEGNNTGIKKIGSAITFSREFGVEPMTKRSLGKKQQLSSPENSALNDSGWKTNLHLGANSVGIWKETKEEQEYTGIKHKPEDTEISKWVLTWRQDEEGTRYQTWVKHDFNARLACGMHPLEVLEGMERSNGGLRLLVTKQEGNRIKEYYCVFPATVFTDTKLFKQHLSSVTGAFIPCKLSLDELADLGQLLQQRYFSEGKQSLKVIGRLGKQPDGSYVFSHQAQFNSQGQLVTSAESGYVFNDELITGNVNGDRVVAPNIKPPTTGVLKAHWEATKSVFGDNKYRAAMTSGAVIAGLKYEDIISKDENGIGSFPIVSLNGEIATGKSTAVTGSLGLIGLSERGKISKATMSAIAQKSEMQNSIPIVWDDPPTNEVEDNKLEQIIKQFFDGTTREVRFNPQTPHCSLIIVSNHTLGNGQSSVTSRILPINFPSGNLNTSSIDAFQAAYMAASAEIGKLIALPYRKQDIILHADKLYPLIGCKEYRVAVNLAIIHHYTLEYLRVAGTEQDVTDYTHWLESEFITEYAQNVEVVADLEHFLGKVEQLLAVNKLGEWNIREMHSDDLEQSYLCICLDDVVGTVKANFKCIQYTVATLKQLLERQGALSNQNVKFAKDKESVQINGAGGYSKQRKAIKIPLKIALDNGWQVIDITASPVLIQSLERMVSTESN